jgi:peptidoglycan/xylan/chitin deacetylase (PgdA/CDA1 family)
VELTPFVRARIVSAGGRDAVGWAEGMWFTLPRPLMEMAGWLRRLQPSGDLTLSVDDQPIPLGAARAVREHAAFTDGPPLSGRLPFNYQRVPGWGRAAIASVIGRWHRGRTAKWAAFPGWPLDLTSDLLADLTAPGRTSRGPAPVVLTHDIDSDEGLENLRTAFLPIEESVGARSVSYIVPCAWPIDHAAVEDVVARGHEVGIHGYDHSNRTAFADTEERRRRLDAARPFADRFHAVGYRAPSLLRTRALLGDLGARYRYDSSIPTSGGLFPVPNNGCATARPFVIEGITEMPLSMPRDGSLRFLGFSAAAIGRLWTECAEAIARSGGSVVLLTHCERRFSGNQEMLATYRRFLEYLAGHPETFEFVGASALAKAAFVMT